MSPGKPRRTPRNVSRASIENVALHYLERFASSAENLRRVLTRRVERAARFHEVDRDEAAAWIAEVVDKLRGLGLLDDRAYAEMRVASLRRRGSSERMIRGKLLQKGVDPALVSASIESDPADDTGAAAAFARRRRIGPYRASARREHRDRDLATLSRAGFSYDVALRIVDAESAAALESSS